MNATVPARLRIVAQNQHTATVEPYGFPMRCVFEFDPGEPPILWPTDRAHPGTPANAELLECWVENTNIFDMLGNSQIERLEDAVLTQMEGSHEQ